MQKGRNAISVEKQVFTALRFYAEGAYQKGVGQDLFNSVAQTTVSKIIHNVTDALCDFRDEFIRFPCSTQQRVNVSRR